MATVEKEDEKYGKLQARAELSVQDEKENVLS
jgi:hypothetical protein